MGVEIDIITASAEHMPIVGQLFREYRASVDAEICFATYEEELAGLPAGYERILLAERSTAVAGCVALRRINPEDCEMKRLFVRPEHQGHGLGRILIAAAVDEATRLGFQRLLLDTLPTMARAIELYRAMGFTPIARYNENPHPSTLFFEKRLSPTLFG